MSCGVFYGIGVGPGDPELLTVKAVTVLRRCRHVFVPKARIAADSVALDIARRHLGPEASVHELLFPMLTDREELARHWAEAAAQIVPVLQAGEDACFLTLGDPLLYSTYIYLLEKLRRQMPDVNAVTIPGITSFCAAAALTQFAIGEGKTTVTIVPTADDLEAVRHALKTGGTVVLMKIGGRLQEILNLLEQEQLLARAVFVARAGQEGQQIETDLRKLKQADAKAGYLSVILVHTSERTTP